MEHHQYIHRLLYNWEDKQGDGADESAPSNYFARLMRDDIVLFIWLVTGISCALLFVILFSKWYLEWRFGIRCCSSNGQERRRIISRDAFIASTQRIRDATIAAEREKKLDEEGRKLEVERKRELLSDVTIAVEDDHLEYDRDALQALEEGTADQQNDVDDDNVVVLHVPGQRRTSAECRICLANVVAGDKIIRSPNPECIHIFHDTCILSWLSESQAKSDCPCCRLPFIPEGYDDDVAATDEEKEPTGNDARSSSNGSTWTMSSSDRTRNSSSDTDESEGFDEEEREDSSV